MILSACRQFLVVGIAISQERLEYAVAIIYNDDKIVYERGLSEVSSDVFIDRYNVCHKMSENRCWMVAVKAAHFSLN